MFQASDEILKEEEEANKFAYELLMPTRMIKSDIAKLDIFDMTDDKMLSKLAKRYGVSSMMMAIRLNQLFEKQIKTAH